MQSLQIPPVDLRLLTPLLIDPIKHSALLLIDVFFVPEGAQGRSPATWR
jgi:NADH dehydrogenase subunit N (EC 1.6.5.3)